MFIRDFSIYTKGQATNWFSLTISSGIDNEHDSWAIGHLVLKLHPLGLFNGLGISPLRTNLYLPFCFGSGLGTEDNKALLYGCLGLK